MTLSVCATHCVTMSIKKLKRCSTNKHWGEKMNYFIFSYFTFRNLNFKLDRKWCGKHSVAYRLKIGWGSRNYMDLEIMSWSNEDIRVRSFLTLHTTRTTTEKIPLILKSNIKYLRKSGNILTVILVCVWESINRNVLTVF